MNLPGNHQLPIEKLSQIFGSMTNSYKALLFKSILAAVHDEQNEICDDGSIEISYSELCAGMLSSVVYPLQVFKLSFGRSDKVSDWLMQLQKDGGWQANALKMSGVEINNALSDLFKNIDCEKLQDTMLRYVIARLIRPWFDLGKVKDGEVNSLIEKASQDSSKKALYLIDTKNRQIVVSSNWVEYLRENYSILLGWWEMNFVRYLEKNNRGVPNLVEKISPPGERKLNDARKAWKEFVEVKSPNCIFTGVVIAEPFAVDHFLPWTFMCHDEMWNLAPLGQSLNSSKSNKLPDKKYVVPFAKLQWQFLQYHLGKKDFKISGKLAEVYLRDLKIESKVLPNSFIAEPGVPFLNAYAEMYEPYFSMAKRMGFSTGWGVDGQSNMAAEDKAPYGDG